MIQVLVADDEPLALENICSIIRKRCKNFNVAATAENGRDALRILRETDVDLVISDIRMPRPGGIELAGIMKDEQPDLGFIIVSGYTDFEYAQSAIRSGVMDYLLKPITPGVLIRALAGAEEKLQRIQYYHRNLIMKQLCVGDPVEEKDLNKYFPEKEYYIALMRRNGLPRRFVRGRNSEIFSDIEEKYTVFGRDEMEAFFLIPTAMIPEGHFGEYLEHIRGKQMQPGDYMTTIYSGEPVLREHLQNMIRVLYERLDQTVQIGHTQEIEIRAAEQYPEENAPIHSLDYVIQKISEAAAAKDYDMLRSQFRKAFLMGEEAGKSQLWMENLTRDLRYILQKAGICRKSVSSIDYMISDAFYNSLNVEQLIEALTDIFFQEDQKVIPKVDSLEFFREIDNYLQEQLRSPISLQQLCHEFGISQTYMSKLFRKYVDMSFNQYLTTLRISRARELMENKKAYYIKDIAAMVGYEDQFYFSRIFRTYTGKSPSEYMKELEQRSDIPNENTKSEEAERGNLS